MFSGMHVCLVLAVVDDVPLCDYSQPFRLHAKAFFMYITACTYLYIHNNLWHDDDTALSISFVGSTTFLSGSVRFLVFFYHFPFVAAHWHKQ